MTMNTMNGNFSAIDEILKTTLKSMGQDFYTQYLRHLIFFKWNEIVGEANAKRVKPLRIEYKRLFVYVNDSSWKSNIFAYKSIFIQKINDFVGQDLIDDILFGSPNERPINEIDTSAASKLPKMKSDMLAKDIILTDDEIEEAEKSCACIENEELRATLLKTAISRIKLEKFRKQNGWHTCQNCNTLAPPEERLCRDCKLKENETFEKTVMKILMDVPWVTYAEVKNEIANTMPQMLGECIPETVESIRGMLIQQICRSLDSKDEKKIKLLVMLFKGAKPEDMTEALIKKALYELRYDLPMKGRLELIQNANA